MKSIGPLPPDSVEEEQSWGTASAPVAGSTEPGRTWHPGPAAQTHSTPGAAVAVAVETESDAPGDLVTCPECGDMSLVETSQRRAADFCRRCDFPLFWARSTVILPSNEQTGASLRRLPGTVGRAATASVPCPHCGEPNSPVVLVCIRCTLSMVPDPTPEPLPPPAPVYLPPPPPEPEPEPRGIPWWWILLIVACILAIAALVWVASS